MTFRSFARAAIAACAILAVLPVRADAWPDRPIKFVMTAPAGSSIDVLGRAIADKLGPRLGQTIVVENKPAAGGTVATAEVAHAAPDGYTMLLGYNGPLSFAPLLQKLPYDVKKDLAPVITTTSQPNVLAVTASLPVHTLAELVADFGDALIGGSTIGAGIAAIFDERDLRVVRAEDVIDRSVD